MIQVKRLVGWYDIGNITGMEASIRIIREITEENAKEVLGYLKEKSPDVHEAVQKRVADYASCTEEQRANFKTFSIVSWCGPWNDEIKKRREAEEERERQLYKRGMDALLKGEG